VATSQKESARLFKQAAEAGEPFAQVKYGLKLLAGEGIDQNKVLGAAWLAVAAESPRIQKTSNATVFREQKEKAWNRLSTEEQRLAEKKKAEISERFENKQ
jgi:TPR repeat protein